MRHAHVAHPCLTLTCQPDCEPGEPVPQHAPQPIPQSKLNLHLIMCQTTYRTLNSCNWMSGQCGEQR